MWLPCNFLAIGFLILSFINTSESSVSENLTGESNQCKIAFNTGEIIDLSLLFNSSQPMILSSPTSLYIYHPCTDVPLNAVQKENACQKGHALCYFVPKTAADKPLNFKDVLSNHTPGNFFLLAVNKEGVSRINQLMEPEIVYKHSQSSEIITTYVRLKCNENIEKYTLTLEKSIPSEHILTLSSKYCCVAKAHYMSGWTVFFIILLLFVALYFIGGILVLKFIRGATGVEMIPNHEFWCKLLELARNGVAYVTSCGKYTPDSYEKI